MRKRITALLLDVDGTLTDGRIYMSGTGEVLKAFCVKDGYAICDILPMYGITPIIVTGRTSEIVKRRAEELNITKLYQGVKDKEACVRTISSKLEIPFEEMAFVGDDMNDLPAMRLCGMVGCPANAVEEVKKIADFISTFAGGQGAVRDFIQWMVND